MKAISKANLWELFIIPLLLIIVVIIMSQMEEHKTLQVVIVALVILYFSSIGAYPINGERHTPETHRRFNLHNFPKTLQMFYGCTTSPCVHEIEAKWNSNLRL